MAIRFNASGDKYTRTTGLPGISAFTIMGWWKISVDLGGSGWVFAYGDTAFDEYLLGYTGARLVNAFNGSTEKTSATTLTVGDWNHLAMTVNGTSGSNFLSYLNGALLITHTARTVPNTQITLAEEGGAVERVDGVIAALKIYTAVLTAVEILQEMRFYHPLRTANLNAWHPFVDPTVANNTTDFSGAGNNLTAGGTLTSEDGPPIAWRKRESGLFIPAAAAPPSYTDDMLPYKHYQNDIIFRDRRPIPY